MDQYKVISTHDFGKFEMECNLLLGQGFKPIGGISTIFVPLTNGICYSQAFYREAKKY